MMDCLDILLKPLAAFVSMLLTGGFRVCGGVFKDTLTPRSSYDIFCRGVMISL